MLGHTNWDRDRETLQTEYSLWPIPQCGYEVSRAACKTEKSVSGTPQPLYNSCYTENLFVKLLRCIQL